MARFLRGITGTPSAWHPLRLRSLLIFVYSDPEVDCGIFKHIPIFVVGFWITYEFSIFYPLQDDDESVPTLAMAYPKLLMMWGWFIFGPREMGFYIKYHCWLQVSWLLKFIDILTTLLWSLSLSLLFVLFLLHVVALVVTVVNNI